MKEWFTPGKEPSRRREVSAFNASTSRLSWISLMGSPLEELPTPRRS